MFNLKTCLPVGQEDMSSCWTRRHVTAQGAPGIMFPPPTWCSVFTRFLGFQDVPCMFHILGEPWDAKIDEHLQIPARACSNNPGMCLLPNKKLQDSPRPLKALEKQQHRQCSDIKSSGDMFWPISNNLQLMRQTQEEQKCPDWLR